MKKDKKIQVQLSIELGTKRDLSREIYKKMTTLDLELLDSILDIICHFPTNYNNTGWQKLYKQTRKKLDEVIYWYGEKSELL